MGIAAWSRERIQVRVSGNVQTEIEAARGYDLASLKYRGDKAVTNFDKSNYSETEIETFKFPHRAHVRDETDDRDEDDNDVTKTMPKR